MQLHCAAQGNEGVSDPRRRLSRDQSEIPSNTGRRNSPACSGTDHFRRAAGSSDTHRYLKSQTGTRDDTGFWDQSCRQGHYRTVHPPTQLFPVRSTSKPSLQVHLYVLSMFSHTPFWQMSGSRAHSLISAKTINRWTYLQEKKPTNSKKNPLKYAQHHLVSRLSVVWAYVLHYLVHHQSFRCQWGTEPGTRLQTHTPQFAWKKQQQQQQK